MKIFSNFIVFFLILLISCKEDREDSIVNDSVVSTTPKEKLTPQIKKIDPVITNTGDTIIIYGENLWDAQRVSTVLFSNIYVNATSDIEGRILERTSGFIKVIVPTDPVFNLINVRIKRGDSISEVSSSSRIRVKSKLWRSTHNVVFSNQWVASFAINGKGYFIDDSKKFQSFDPASGSVLTIKFLPEGLFIVTAFSIGQKGYIMIDSDLKLKLWEFDPLDESWTQKADCNVKPYFLGGFSFTLDSKAYIGGGDDGVFVSYDAIENKWSKLSDYPGVNANGVGAISLNGNGYCFGGGYSNRLVGSRFPSLTNYNKNWQYNPTTDLWTRIADVPDNIVDRSYGVTTHKNDKIYFGAGYSNLYGSTQLIGAIYEFTPSTNTWKLHNFSPYENIGIMFLGFQVNDKTYLKQLSSGSPDFDILDLSK